MQKTTGPVDRFCQPVGLKQIVRLSGAAAQPKNNAWATSLWSRRANGLRAPEWYNVHYAYLITFRAKDGKSSNLDQIRESIKATRLSGGTQMRVTYLEVTVMGELTTAQQETMLKVKGTGQEFTLAEAPTAEPKGGKTALQRLREALGRGEKVASITGRVEGWDGRFPDVLRALEGKPDAPSKRIRLLVTDFGAGP